MIFFLYILNLLLLSLMDHKNKENRIIKYPKEKNNKLAKNNEKEGAADIL